MTFHASDMKTLAPFSLWSDAHRTRFFLIPDDQQLPSGEFAIHTITGRKLAVDPVSVAQFEITEAEAKKWLESQLGSMLDTAHGAVERFIDRLTGASEDPLAATRAAMKQFENALNQLELSSPAETQLDVTALQDCAERVSRIADRLRSVAQRHAR